MTSLFTLPGQTPFKNGAIVPGAKLYFYQTTTSTPQNTYTTEALSVAHANPVIADANGLFPAIYLDPSLPSYRATLTDASDVLIQQWDGVPSNQSQATSLRVVSTAPSVILYDTDGTANQRKYRILVNSGAFTIASLNDAENSSTTILSIDSATGVLNLASTATVNSIDVGGTTVRKTSSTSRTNNTLTIDPDLQIVMPASPKNLYRLEAMLMFQCGSTTPGTNLQIAIGGTGTCRYVVNGSSDGATTTVADALNFAITAGTSANWTWTNTARHIAHIEGYILGPGINGQTLAFYWSQAVTNATALTLDAGSFLRVQAITS